MSKPPPMKKLSLLIGTLGGATAGYLFSNKKLRDQLTNAKDTEAAAKILGKHLQTDGKKLAAQVREFIESEEVQKNVSSAKKYASTKVKEAKTELNSMVKDAKKQAKTTAKKTAKRATTSAKKAVTTGKTKAKATKGRMKTKTRKLS